MKVYLEETDIINFSNKEVHALAMYLASDCEIDEQVAKKCFEYVRDEIRHSGDHKDNIIIKDIGVFEIKTFKSILK